MFGHDETTPGSLGSRRRGGPVLLKDLMPALLEELHEVYLANGELPRLDATAAPETELDTSTSFSRAA